MYDIILQEKLSEQTENRNLMFGSKINLRHIASGTVLSSKVSELKSLTSSQLKSPCDMSASLMTNPCPRNVFQICRYLIYLAFGRTGHYFVCIKCWLSECTWRYLSWWLYIKFIYQQQGGKRIPKASKILLRYLR